GDAERFYVERLCSEPGRYCNPTQSLAKFYTFLTLVFENEGVSIFAVP
ncbi:unnamed protein product, partial [marine sediment metagenome]